MPEPAPRLVVTDPTGRRIVPIDKALLTIGRRSETDVRISVAGVSRLHAEISVDNGVCAVRDKESKLGTFVNGQRVSAQQLAHGDRISLGQSNDVTIVFLVDEDSSSVERSATVAAGELRQMAKLLEGLRALGSGRVLDEVLALVLDSAIEVTGAERGFIMLADEGNALDFKLARGRGRFTLAGRTFDTSRKIPEAVFASGKQAIVEDLREHGLADTHMNTVAFGIRSVLCTPLRLVRYLERAEERADEKTIGVLYLDSRERGSLLADATRAALETLSIEAAVAIENARLYRQALDRARDEQELKVAAEIQRALLPPAERRGAFFETAGASVTCRAVGGDFFDYVDLPAGQFGFILGDVAGKGSPAALLASALLGMFSAEAVYHTNAANITSRLNGGLVRRGIEGRFVTAFYGVMDASGHLTYSNAGHNAPLLMNKAGVRRLETGGTVLGLFEHATFEEETLPLEPGDLVIVFSDGVTEAMSEAGEEFGDERLIACAERLRGNDAPVVVSGILSAVRAFSVGTRQSDDITVVVIRFGGPCA